MRPVNGRFGGDGLGDDGHRESLRFLVLQVSLHFFPIVYVEPSKSLSPLMPRPAQMAQFGTGAAHLLAFGHERDDAV